MSFFSPRLVILSPLCILGLIRIAGHPAVIWTGVSGGTSTAHRSTPHMASRIPKTRTQLPWSAVQSSCSSSDGGPACIRGLSQTGRTCWWMLKWRCCYISPSKRCQRGCSNAASPLQSPSSRNYINMAVIYRL